jgi:hypothetical protein
MHAGGRSKVLPWGQGGTGVATEEALTTSDGLQANQRSPGGGIFFHWAPEPEKYTDSEAWHTQELPAPDINRSWMYTVPIQMNSKDGIDLVSGGKGTPLVWFESPPEKRHGISPGCRRHRSWL